MKDKIFTLKIAVIIFLSSCIVSYSQNLLDTSTWTVGSGSVAEFTQNGTTAENMREYRTGPHGNSAILWKAIPDDTSGPDGGWNTSSKNIDNLKTYRFTVWIKKTNSINGSTYFGCTSNNNILSLVGTVDNNAYFWSGDLPELDKWYLLVGYVHSSNYNSNLNYGGIYDGTTGIKVKNITDFKFAITATSVAHRAYLYYDTNVNDRQYFYDPRLEQVNNSEPSIEELLNLNNDTNMLSTSSWVEGTGSVTGYTQSGSTDENIRELGIGSQGDIDLLWKAAPNSSLSGDGGWNSTSNINIDPSKTYRLAVWLKKTNSTDGITYFGCMSYNHLYTLSGTLNNNPYFWNGDLPQLNKWYLLIGYVHGYSYSSTVNDGGIYDGDSGLKVASITDFKFDSSATYLVHRSFLYNDANTNDRLYLQKPRMDEINGKEPDIDHLIRENYRSRLIFSYDLAGNQSQRFYCADPDFCVPLGRKGIVQEEGVENVEVESITQEDEILNTEKEIAQVYPNPFEDRFTIRIKDVYIDQIESIYIFNTQGVLVKLINRIDKPDIIIELQDNSTGLYLVKIQLINGEYVTKKILKK